MSTRSNTRKREPQKTTFDKVGEFRFGFSVDSISALPAKIVYYSVFLTVLGVVYIANNHFADRMARDINRLEEEVEELRVDYTTLKYEYMYISKRSEVEEKVKPRGLTADGSTPIDLDE